MGGRCAGLEARAPRLSPLPRLHCPDQTTLVAPLHPARAPLPVPSQYPPSTRPGGSPASSWAGASAARTGASSACARRARPVRLGASFKHERCHPSTKWLQGPVTAAVMRSGLQVYSTSQSFRDTAARLYGGRALSQTLESRRLARAVNSVSTTPYYPLALQVRPQSVPRVCRVHRARAALD